MKLEIKAPTKIEDGKHVGIIRKVEYRTEPYKYTDLIIEFETNKSIKVGFPTAVTPTSKLGTALLEFGASLEVGGSIDPEEVFKDKPCSFLTITENTARGSFPKVVPGSLKSQ